MKVDDCFLMLVLVDGTFSVDYGSRYGSRYG
jgi:hypothetical protein